MPWRGFLGWGSVCGQLGERPCVAEAHAGPSSLLPRSGSLGSAGGGDLSGPWARADGIILEYSAAD